MESNLDDDYVITMEEINLMNNEITCIDICRLSNSKLVDVDDSISSMYCLVTDNISIPENTSGNDTRFCHVADYNVGCSGTSLF